MKRGAGVGSLLEESCTYSFLVIMTVMVFLIPGVSAQQTNDNPLEVGEKAPDFEIPSTVAGQPGTHTVRISALIEQGKTVVVAFFPKAFTGG